MKKIGLFYGSDTGCTEGVTDKLIALLGESNVDTYDMSIIKEGTEFQQYEYLLLGIPTWYDGDLQSDWEVFYPKFQELNFTGKTVAIYGLGDQIGYAEYFIDGVGILANTVLEQGGQIVGLWSTKGYLHTESKAEVEDGAYFLGLAIDEDNESEQTEERLTVWAEQIIEEMELVLETI